MTDNFKKIIIVSTVIFVTLFFLGTGIVFFPKEKDEDIPSQNNKQEEEQQQQQQLKNSIKTELTEKEKIKMLAENFVVIYYSYTWGEFSNIETQYDYMSEKMKNEEKNKVEQIKQETKNQPRKYFSARAKLISSAVLSYGENEAEIAVDLNVTNFAGAIIQREIMVWVDEKGDPYVRDVNNLITSSENKKIKINFIKDNDKLKVDKIEDIEE